MRKVVSFYLCHFSSRHLRRTHFWRTYALFTHGSIYGCKVDWQFRSSEKDSSTLLMLSMISFSRDYDPRMRIGCRDTNYIVRYRRNVHVRQDKIKLWNRSEIKCLDLVRNRLFSLFPSDAIRFLQRIVKSSCVRVCARARRCQPREEQVGRISGSTKRPSYLKALHKFASSDSYNVHKTRESSFSREIVDAAAFTRVEIVKVSSRQESFVVSFEFGSWVI